MPAGPGKYDELATHVRERSDAELVLVAVIAGNKGSGFSVQGKIPYNGPLIASLLRSIADDIEAVDEGRPS
jgi:hypothetical protein